MRLHSIQSLRGVAALSVVACHTYSFDVGAAGVDIFFVISGFIIATVMQGREPTSFAWDRFWRVYPLFWLFLIPYLGTDPARLAASITLWPVWGGYHIPYYEIGWTLSFEILFYLAATASLALGTARPLFAAYAVALAWFIAAPNPLVSYIGNPMILEFRAGVAIWKLPKKPLLGGALLLGGVALFALHNIPELNGIVARYKTPGMAGFRLLYWGVPAAMIVYGSLSLEGLFRSRLLLLFGNASYSIYLAHPVVIWALELSPTAEFALAALAGIGVHFLIEKPILRAKPGSRGGGSLLRQPRCAVQSRTTARYQQ